MGPDLQHSPQVWTAPGNEIASQSDISRIARVFVGPGSVYRHILGLSQTISSNLVVKHRAASIELLRSLPANGEGYGISYTNPPGSMTYDCLQIARVRISDAHAVGSVVLVSTGSRPAPIG